MGGGVRLFPYANLAAVGPFQAGLVGIAEARDMGLLLWGQGGRLGRIGQSRGGEKKQRSEAFDHALEHRRLSC